jgi:hypothetical protein
MRAVFLGPGAKGDQDNIVFPKGLFGFNPVQVFQFDRKCPLLRETRTRKEKNKEKRNKQPP